MIPTPFRFEANLIPEDFQKIGQLSLRWSHTDHTIANCLRVMLRLSDDEAIVIVFPLSLDQRLRRINELRTITPLSPKAEHAFQELRFMMKGVQAIRNNIIHSVLFTDEQGDPVFHLRSKRRTLSKAQVFEAEELTNYAAHAALVLRDELGDKDPLGPPSPLPARPAIPESLRTLFQKGGKAKPKRDARRRLR